MSKQGSKRLRSVPGQVRVESRITVWIHCPLRQQEHYRILTAPARSHRARNSEADPFLATENLAAAPGIPRTDPSEGFNRTLDRFERLHREGRLREHEAAISTCEFLVARTQLRRAQPGWSMNPHRC